MEWNIGKYLIKRLEQIGIKHIFGVPGDFNLGFLDQIVDSNLKLITTCNELNAGYAGDGYARINGAGAVVITYAVGGLSAINAAAGAFAEDIPLIIISGSPPSRHYAKSTLLHHTLGDYEVQLKMYKLITVEAELLKDPQTATAQIDKALKACLLYKKPVYIELPKDIDRYPCQEPEEFVLNIKPSYNHQLFKKAVDQAVEMLTKCKNPAILAGTEINRQRLQPQLIRLIEKTGYPFSTMILDKSIISEEHPQFIGLYQGAMSNEYVKQRLEGCSSLLCLGTLMSDANLGWFTANLKDENLIIAAKNYLTIGSDYYNNIPLKDFIEALTEKLPAGNISDYDITPASERHTTTCLTEKIEDLPDKKLTMDKFFDMVSCIISSDDIIISDIGSYLYSAIDMLLPQNATFIDQSFYCSIGYSVGATLGVSKAAPDRRVITFVGDGAFQMTAQELSTIIRDSINAIIFLINNDGYTIERLIHEGPYNDLQNWHYHKMPEIFGGKPGYDIHTEGDLEKILKEVSQKPGTHFIEVHFERMDSSETLKKTLDSLK